MSSKRVFTTIKWLCALGITLALYLLWQQIFSPTFKPCSISTSVNCDAVISGPVAKTFGVPTPLFGLVGYMVILFAAAKRMKRLMFGVTVGGFAFCAYIAYIELVIIKVICPICILCQLTMISIFVLQIYLNFMVTQKKCTCTCCETCDCKDCTTACKCDCKNCSCSK